MKSVTKTSSLRDTKLLPRHCEDGEAIRSNLAFEIASSHSTKSGMLLAMTVAFLFCTLTPVPYPLTYAADSTSVSNEFTGRLDDSYGQSQSVRNKEPQSGRTEEPIYSGGQGAGYAMGEYTGRLDKPGTLSKPASKVNPD